MVKNPPASAIHAGGVGSILVKITWRRAWRALNILAKKSPQTEESGIASMRLQRIRHNREHTQTASHFLEATKNTIPLSTYQSYSLSISRLSCRCPILVFKYNSGGTACQLENNTQPGCGTVFFFGGHDSQLTTA